jgi:uncharacterized protein DUF4901
MNYKIKIYIEIIKTQMTTFGTCTLQRKIKKFNISIAIDAKTGELLNFHKSLEQDPDDKSTIDEKAALEMARKYLKKTKFR